MVLLFSSSRRFLCSFLAIYYFLALGRDGGRLGESETGFWCTPHALVVVEVLLRVDKVWATNDASSRHLIPHRTFVLLVASQVRSWFIIIGES